MAKYTGLFWMAQRSTRKGLRILCYHGFTSGDLNRFRPKLFMSPGVFRARMEKLHQLRYPVLSLGEAVECLERNDLPDNATVITIDDGWTGTLTEAAPILRHYHFPATLYITSYYVDERQPVLNMLVQYLFWKTGMLTFNMSSLDPRLHGRFNLRKPAERETAEQSLIEFTEHYLTAAERPDFLVRLARELQLDPDKILSRNDLRIVSRDQIAALAKSDIDIQLHSHRHRFPQDSRADAAQEISDNRAVLEAVVGQKLTHFCYPSGQYAQHQLPWLADFGIKSATTTMAGLNYAPAALYELTRFLDGENIYPIEFEAELSGFLDIVRRLRRKWSRAEG